MALQATNLSASITASQLTISVGNGTLTSLPAVGAVAMSYGVPMQIGSEITYVVSQPVLNTLVLRMRGADGTSPMAHDVNSNVYVSNQPGDFPLPSAGTLISVDAAQDTAIDIGQDSTITPQNSNVVYNINKPTACAIVLAAPSLAGNGTTLTFTSNTAAAHTITATSLIHDASGVLHSTATCTANLGCSVVFAIENGFYNVIGTALGVTFS